MAADGAALSDLPDPMAADGAALGDLPDPMAAGGAALGDLPDPMASDPAMDLPDPMSTDAGMGGTPAPRGPKGSVVALQKIQQLKVKVQAVLGTVPLTISDLANLGRGDLIELETKLGEPIEILANGDLIAKAEIVVTQDDPPRFGLTLTEIVDADGSNS